MQALRMMKLVKILKMVRVLKASRIFQRWEAQIALSFATQSMLKFGCAIFIVAHWVACVWGMTAAIQDDEAYTWLDAAVETKLGFRLSDDAYDPLTGQARNAA